MAFDNGIVQEVEKNSQGEVLVTSPYNISSYDIFEDGLTIGRFVKYDAGSIDNLDGSATPVIVGVPVRKVNKAIGSDVYVSSGTLTDKNTDICDFGKITVSVTDAADPKFNDPVYIINAAGADAGKATQDSGATGALLVENVKFSKEIKEGVWLVTLQNYLA